MEEIEDDRCFIVAEIVPDASDILSPEDEDSVVSKQRASRDWDENISIQRSRMGRKE